MKPSGLHRKVGLDTPEHVRLDYVLADLGSRASALLLDLLIVVGILSLITLAVFLLRRVGLDFLSLGGTILILAIFVLVWGYFMLFEGLSGGRTPGKRVLGLRVIHVGGEPLSFQGAVLRNLIRLVDLQPGGTGMAGAVSILVNSRAQRLGDIVAGTLVVRDAAAGKILELDELPSTRVGRPILSVERFELLASYVSRRSGLSSEDRSRLAASIVRSLEDSLPDSRDESSVGADERLTRLHAQEAPRHAARRSGVSLQASALARERRADWARYADLVNKGRKKGLKRLPEADVRAFGQLYRGMTADLARAQTYGASAGLLSKVRQWTGAGHNLLYRRRGRAAISIVHWVAKDFPRMARGYWRHILLASVLFYGPAVATYVAAIQDPLLGRSIAGQAMLTRAENIEQDNIDAPYLEGESVAGPDLAAMLMTNNVGVTFQAFAGGLLAGLGTLLILVFNGVLLGGVLGAFANEGVLGVILAFVFPHGFIELTAICISGGAGFGLGSALLMPGRRTRADALRERGRSFLGLIGGAALMLVVAGLIEGFFSPSSVPAVWKFAFGGTTAVMLVLYFGLAGRRGAPGRGFPTVRLESRARPAGT